MATIQEKRQAVQRILQSREFENSPVSARLLQYLCDCALRETTPKETTIAIEVFGKDPSFDSSKDSTVRYHVHLLRRKLHKYYQEEGRHEKLRVVIPKGHYRIDFTPAPKSLPSRVGSLVPVIRKWSLAIIGVLLGVVAILALLLVRSTKPPVGQIRWPQPVRPDDKIWAPFFANGYPVLLVVGDDFLLDEYCPEYQRYRQIRDWQIDSENDLAEFLVRFPNARLWKSEITGFPVNGIWNLMDLLPIIYQFQPNVTVAMSSSLTLEQLRGHNMIYFGEFKNLRILNKIFNRLPVRYQYHPEEELYLLNDRGDTTQAFHRIQAPYAARDKYNIDYSMLVKMPGLVGENLMFIVGFGYSGRLERTKMLADSALRAAFVKQVEKLVGRFPPYFVALFEVKSIERTGFSNELRYFRELPPDFFSP
ncbi:MAG: hypothetical protein ONB23_04110 [candidate division KSB1 bacterium]|nr:hypothetical protein [candidate division KSB1 bacterium]